MELNRELVAASTIPLVLGILRHEDSYGYAIIKRIKQLSNDQIAWSDGMLYPVLRRLEEQRFITSYWKTSETGRRRRYYRIENEGTQGLERWRQQWTVVDAVLGHIWTEANACST